ncbi:hypothetical protein ACLD02_04795 [Alloalcanivorax sp. C16-2]|uniref:hypothetical protein n=1 Tax=Alloalcanivorax sp. C16-2 TaxID=3390052 RepID=UPI003970A7E2
MFTRKHPAVAALLATGALLCACNESSSSSAEEPGSETPNSLVLSDENAAEALRLALDTPRVLPDALLYLVMYAGMGASQETCLNDPEGTVDGAMTGNRPDQARFDNCAVEQYYGETTWADGHVRFAFENEQDVSPFTMTMEDYALHTLRPDPYWEETLQADGAVHISPSSYGMAIASIRDFNGSLEFTSRQGGSQNPWQVDSSWTFNGFGLEIEEGGRGPESLTMEGQLSFSSPLQGSVTLTTHVPLYHSHDEMIECPDRGDLTMEGDEGTSLNLSIIDNETLQVTVNGVTDTYDCEGFLEWSQGNFIF